MPIREEADSNLKLSQLRGVSHGGPSQTKGKRADSGPAEHKRKKHGGRTYRDMVRMRGKKKNSRILTPAVTGVLCKERSDMH